LFFQTKKAAEKHLAETSAKASRGEYLDRARVPIFKDAAELWFRSKTDRRASHVADLRARLDKHILPRVGAIRLDRIMVGSIEKLRDDLRTDAYAPRTINTIIRIVGAVFSRLSGAATLSAIRSIGLNAPSWRRASCARVKMKPAATTTRSARTRCSVRRKFARC
jgi:hypothetical protein